MIARAEIGELFVLGFRGLTVPAWLRDFAARFGLGGAVLFDYDVASRTYGRNVESPAQVRALCAELAALPGAPLVLVDQEGGRVRRLKEALGFAPLPSARAFARLPAPEQAALARAAFAELRALGIGLNLAPVVDLDLNPANPDIGAVERSFSADPAVVRDAVSAFAQAAREAGLGLCLKHYPGLGGARTSSHLELTDLTGCVPPEQLALFDTLAASVPGEAILVSHGIVADWEPDVPVSMSPVALSALRAQLPEVLLISDDLHMQGLQARFGTEEACRRGLGAGLDWLLLGNNLRDEAEHAPALAEALAEAVAADSALSRRAADALARVRARKQALGR